MQKIVYYVCLYCLVKIGDKVCDIMIVCTCGRCNANKTSDHALYGAKHSRLTKVEGIQHDPYHDASSSTHVCVKDSKRCNGTSHKWTSTVESTPTHPKQSCACKHHYHVIWCCRKCFHVLLCSRTHLLIIHHHHMQKVSV